MKKKNIFRISLLLYVISLASPIFFESDVYGLIALIFGSFGVLSLDLTIGLPWIANLLYFINLSLFKGCNYKSQIIISSVTLLFALVVISIETIPTDDEGNIEIVSVGIGFFLWIASFIALLFGQILLAVRNDENS